MISQNHSNNALAIVDQSVARCLDSRASNHVTNNRNLLVHIRPVEHDKVVRTAGGQSLSVKGIGFVVIKLPSGEMKTIGNIFYVPGLTKNLFSVGSIEDKGLTIRFSPHVCHVVDKHTNQTLIKGLRDSINSLYRIEDSILVNCIEFNVTSPINPATLWHAILGHPTKAISYPCSQTTSAWITGKPPGECYNMRNMPSRQTVQTPFPSSYIT